MERRDEFISMNGEKDYVTIEDVHGLPVLDIQISGLPGNEMLAAGILQAAEHFVDQATTNLRFKRRKTA
jgi:hypothetical protein